MSANLTAVALIREALVIFANIREGHDATLCGKIFPSYCCRTSSADQFCVDIALSVGDLKLSLDKFAERLLRPAMGALNGSIPPTAKLSAEPFELPTGVLAAETERYRGVAMRVIIHEEPHNGRHGLPGSVKRYFDPNDDEFKTGMVGLCARFDVRVAA